MVLSDRHVAILRAREQRVKRHACLWQAFRGTLLALTLNIPGPDKCIPSALTAFKVGQKCMNTLFATRGVSILIYEETVGDDGFEACWVVDMPAQMLKAWAMKIEEEHLLGRLFDFDVQNKEGQFIHRETSGNQPRKCLVCNETAHGCARSQRHTLENLMDGIETLVDTYKRRACGEQSGENCWELGF